MAPKRGGRSSKIMSKNIDYNNLKLSDSLCPICRSILIEPVTLTCNHGFCLSCFEGTMANSNLVCPLCRLRIGSWLRSAKKENRLVNSIYWQAIKQQFPVQVQNRLQGLEENLPEDDPKIKLSDPGEIRKEYEVQKKKDDEELERLKALEEKASESLLQKYQEELDYQKAVEEEKIKQDEQVARKLAEKLAQAGSSKPSTVTKRSGTLDGFLKLKSVNGASTPKKSNYTIPIKDKIPEMTYTASMQKNLDSSFNCNVRLNDSLSNFATKEYTCIILKQNNSHEQSTNGASNLSFIRKKCQQLQKLTEAEYVSDSSDCIESECRYFNPIDYKYNPRTAYKPAIKVPSKVSASSSSSKIRPPSGKILFILSDVSAFARVPSPFLDALVNSKNKTQAVSNGNAIHKLQNCNMSVGGTTTKVKRKNQNTVSDSGKKIKLSQEMGALEKPKANGIIFEPSSSSESPPFCGFKRENLRSQSKTLSNGLDTQELKKRLQEKADLEFAKKLHRELNNHSRYPTRGNSNKRKPKRQVTLDEIMVTM